MEARRDRREAKSIGQGRGERVEVTRDGKAEIGPAECEKGKARRQARSLATTLPIYATAWRHDCHHPTNQPTNQPGLPPAPLRLLLFIYPFCCCLTQNCHCRMALLPGNFACACRLRSFCWERARTGHEGQRGRDDEMTGDADFLILLF